MLYQIVAVLAIMLAAVGVWLYLSLRRNAKEVLDKTSRSTHDPASLPVEFQGAEPFASIVKNFNLLLQKLRNLGDENRGLAEVQTENRKLQDKVHEAESTGSEVKMYTKMGREITQALNVDGISAKLFDHINRSCPLDELELWVKDRNLLYSVKGGKISKFSNVLLPTDSLQSWVLNQGRSARLDDNETEYTRFLYKPVQTHSGNTPKAVFCEELYIGNKKLGTFTLYSHTSGAFPEHLTDFIQSLGSYTAIALENAGVVENLDAEKGKSDALLLNILPKETADELKETGAAKPRHYDSVTVLFTDFKSFTNVAESMNPEELVSELDACFRQFDEIALKYGVEKIKTIGDAWLGVCGLPQVANDHAIRAARAAVEIRDFLKTFRESPGHANFIARIGLHSGPLVAGVVGKSKFAYDIWGDTVNTAARMEQSGEIGKVNVSGATWELVKDHFKGEYRGKIEAKNKGAMDMYFIEKQ